MPYSSQGLRLLLDGKPLRFASSRHYYRFREALLYLHQGNTLIEGVEIRGGGSGRLIVLEKLFDLSTWREGIESNNLDLFSSNRKTTGVADIAGAPEIHRDSHCAEREYINIQYFLQGIWWTEERKGITEKAGEADTFHILIFDCFYISAQAPSSPQKAAFSAGACLPHCAQKLSSSSEVQGSAHPPGYSAYTHVFFCFLPLLSLYWPTSLLL